MEIRILKYINNALLKETEVGWEFAARKHYSGLKWSAVLAVVLLLIGFFESSKKNTFWNFYTCTGLANSLVCLQAVYNLYKGKKRWIHKCKLYIANKSQAQQPIEYLINGASLSIKDPEYNSEFKWSIFADYIIYKNILFIFLSAVDTSNISFDLNSIAQDDKTNLIKLVGDKLPLRQQ